MASLRLVIVGAGGLGRELSQYAEDTWSEDQFTILGHLDDGSLDSLPEGVSLRHPHLGPIDFWNISANDRFLLAIGQPTTRAAVADRLLEKGAQFVTLIHPLAYVAQSATIGRGCAIAPYATVGAGAKIGEFTNLHFYSSAAHDTRIGNYVSLSPYAVANGQVHIGDFTFLGTHTTLNPTVVVGSNVRVTSGSVVYRAVPDGMIAAGNPAKARKIGGF